MADTTPTVDEAIAFGRAICAAAGIRVHVFPDGTTGLIDVPVKYVAVIDALHQALINVCAGEPLPELAPRPPRKGRRHG